MSYAVSGRPGTAITARRSKVLKSGAAPLAWALVDLPYVFCWLPQPASAAATAMIRTLLPHRLVSDDFMASLVALDVDSFMVSPWVNARRRPREAQPAPWVLRESSPVAYKLCLTQRVQNTAVERPP